MSGKREAEQWFKEPLRILQFNIEDKYGDGLEGLRGSKLVELAKNIGANVLVLFARDPWGRAFYRGSSVNQPHIKMRGDLIREAIAEGRRLGVRVVAMVAHTANKRVYALHSDWAQINLRGEVIMLEHAPLMQEDYSSEWPELCINSPYMEYLKDELDEVVRLGVDGVFLDSFRYQPDLEKACYCKWCRKRFLKDKGYEMPTSPDWSDSRWRELWSWRYEVVVKALRDLYLRAKSRNEKILVMYNSHPGGWAGRTNRVVELGRKWMDFIFAECSEADHQPPGFITEMVKLTKAMGGGKPVAGSRNYFHMYRTSIPTTPLSLRQGLRESIIGGGDPWLLIFSSSYLQDNSLLKAAKQVFSEHRKLEPYLREPRPLRHAGIVVSNLTRDFYGRDHPWIYVDELRGFYYALTHEHIPVQFIAERDLDNAELLRQFKVIILPNTACLNERARQSLKSYVESGGGLIASFLTSAYNDECVELGDFSLSEVLGINLKGVLNMRWSYIQSASNDHPVLKGLSHKPIICGDMTYDMKELKNTYGLGSHTVVRPEPANVLAYLALPASDRGYEYTLGRSSPSMGPSLKSPAILENRFGRGRVIYFTFQLGQHYWRTGMPEYRSLIVNSVKYVGGEPLIQVVAPETLATEYYNLGSDEGYLMHFLNHTYNQRILSVPIGGVKQPLPQYSSYEAVHPPRYAAKLANISVILREADLRECEAFSPLTNTGYRCVKHDNHYVIDVPTIGEYEVIVVNSGRR